MYPSREPTSPRIPHRRSNLSRSNATDRGAPLRVNTFRVIFTPKRGLAAIRQSPRCALTAQAEVRFTNEAASSGATAAEARRQTARFLRDKPIAGRTTRDTCCASARAVCILIPAWADHLDPRVPNCGIPCPCSLRRLWPRGGPELSRGRWAYNMHQGATDSRSSRSRRATT
jgi:hypothetical protein